MSAILKQIKRHLLGIVNGKIGPHEKEDINKGRSSQLEGDVAIIGMACRFPGANNYNEFWSNLAGGVNSISEIPPSRWDVNEYYSKNIDEPNKTISKWCGLVRNIDKFDNRFFNISPRESNNMDPQQRLLLEETYHCIEDSGVSMARLREKRTSVYIGVMSTDYYSEASAHANIDSYAGLGSYECILANRLSYYFGLSGSSMSINTACASSLVAIHEAKRSLRLSESDYAVAGGVSLNFHPFKYISFSKARMLSPDGQCRTFDADANGYVPGDGVGVLLLQRLGDAMRDGNHIYGVIKGSAVNHTGQSLSITAPRMESQRDVILEAWGDAGMGLESAGYIEAHGTGTSLGDPIEVEALTKAFERHTDKYQFCSIGSVKSNIGHLEAAAGVAGVVKVLLMMRHRRIPRTLNIKRLNPIINFENTPFRVALEDKCWEVGRKKRPLRAGISSFGFGGANAHMVLEEYRCAPGVTSSSSKGGELFVLSARTAQSMNDLVTQWREFAVSDEYKEFSLADICGTLCTSREAFSHRTGSLVRSKDELEQFLSDAREQAVVSDKGKMHFLIGGIEMSGFQPIASLYEENPFLRARILEFESILDGEGFGRKEAAGFKENRWQERLKPLYTFMACYACVASCVDSGVEPDLVSSGKSGALIGLVLSGMLDLVDALKFSAGKLDIKDLSLRRPAIPFYDPVNGRTIKPYRIDERYLHEFMDGLDVEERSIVQQIFFEEIANVNRGASDSGTTRLGQLLLRKGVIDDETLKQALGEKERSGRLLGAILVEKGCCTVEQIEEALSEQDILRTCVDKARILQEKQFTFRKYLEEWNDVLKKAGKNLDDMLHDESLLTSSNNGRAGERVLLLIVVLNSLRRLNRKWNLSEQVLVTDPRFYELLDLLSDGVLSQEEVVSLLLSETPDYGRFAALIDSRQHLISETNEYKLLRNHGKALTEIEDKNAWVRALIEATPRNNGECCCVTFGFGMVDDSEAMKNDVYVSFAGDMSAAFKESLLALWLKGINPRWSSIYPEGSFNKLPLPGYPFERRSFWLSGSEMTKVIRHKAPIIQAADAEAAEDGIWKDTQRYGRDFSVDDPIVRDHVITGRHLIPAAGMIDLGFEAGSKVSRDPVLYLKNVVVRKPGIVEDSISLSVRINPEGREFGIVSGDVELCKGRYDGAKFSPLPSIDVASFTRLERIPLDGLYLSFIRAGYQYGSSLRVIKAAWKNGNAYLFRLESSDIDYFSEMNPHLLDGMFQCVLASGILDGGSEPSSSLHVPYMVGSISFDGMEQEGCYALIDLSKLSEHKGDIVAGISAYDDEGRNIARIENMVFVKVSNSFLSQTQPAGSLAARRAEKKGVHFYKPAWVPLVLHDSNRNADLSETKALIFADDDGAISALKKELGNTYSDVAIVKSGATFSKIDNVYELDPEDGESYGLLLEDVLSESQGAVSGIDIFYLWSYESAVRYPSIELGPDRFEDLIKPLFNLTKSLISVSSRETVRLLVCTRDAHAVVDSDRIEGFAYGSFSGFMKTVSLEVPHMHLRLIDFGGDAADVGAVARSLPAEAADTKGFEIAAYRNSQRYVRSIAPVDIPPSEQQSAFKDGGVHLLVGGAGGLGMKIAKMVAESCKARLALLDRADLSALGEEKMQAFDALRALGSEVEYLSSDVTSPENMRSAVERIKAMWGKIDGVIQVTGLLEDRLLINKEWDSFKRVMLPKVTGTLVLHEALRDADVHTDFFAVFSSIVSVMGNVGQSDYASANSFLDAFVQYRSRAGYPGSSAAINWTLWADGGMGMDERTRAQFQKRLGLIESAKGLDALRSILVAGEPQVIVAGRDLITPEESGKRKVKVSAKRVPASGRSIKAPDSSKAIKKSVREILSGILHVDREELGDEIDLKEYGLDSVALTELSEKITEALEIEFNPSLFFEYTTIESLSGYICGKIPESSAEEQAKTGREIFNDSSHDKKVSSSLLQLLSAILHVDGGEIDEDTDLKEYGLDSVALTELSEKISESMGVEFNPSLLFEYNTVASLTDYISSRGVLVYEDENGVVEEEVDEGPATAPPKPGVIASHEVARQFSPAEVSSRVQAKRSPEDSGQAVIRGDADGIAIIGMSGIFPGSPDLESFWNNLESEKDLISEIPSDRFDWRRYFGDPTREDNRMNCKWGGFIEDVDKFDTAFFNISPREAELMDPQQRLMLQVTWRAIEDAGYAVGAFAETKTGVFIGVCNDDYSELLESEHQNVEAYTSTGNYFSIVPNRISFYLNLRGPSVAVETACSSSLIAIHQAVKAIQNGECSVAIAGGVNALLTPKRFISFSKAGMLCEDGRCKTFDKRANGYVRGEGAGAIVLKPLSRALKDGDHVYGVIRASSENHGGRANSLTAPNPVAQAELLFDAYTRAGIAPWQVSYIECHGTGTSLGDPVEVNGLKKAFEDLYQTYDKEFKGDPYCGLGTVKTNIGHLESAAGIAGVIKVLLSLKNRKLPGVVHFQELNPYIDIKGSPFYVVAGTREWKRLSDKTGQEIPRIAGVSSFGFGGANAHIVIEEYDEDGKEAARAVREHAGDHLFVLSARNKERLGEYARELLDFISTPEALEKGFGDNSPILNALKKELRGIVASQIGVGEEEVGSDEDIREYGADEVKLSAIAISINERFGTDITLQTLGTANSIDMLAQYLMERHGKRLQEIWPDLKVEAVVVKSSGRDLNIADLAYTLQLGRDVMDERLAVIASSSDELAERLKQYVSGKIDSRYVYCGNARTDRGRLDHIISAEEGRAYLKSLIEHKRMPMLAELWVSGVKIGWEMLYSDREKRPSRISLPAYPFKRDRYWISDSKRSYGEERGAARLHDLLDSNESTLSEQRYRKVLTGSEYYLRDHVVGTDKVLPGVAYIEMARLAGDLSGGGPKVARIKDVLWLRPVVVDDGKVEVYVSLYPEGDAIEYEVTSSSGNGGERIVNSQGKIEYERGEDKSVERMDINAIRSRCDKHKDKAAVYALSRSMGLNYGPSFQAISELSHNDEEALAELRLPEGLKGSFGEYVLHPALMDAALQSVLSLVRNTGDNRTYVPFSLGDIQITRPLSDRCYAYAHSAGNNAGSARRFDIDVMDGEGTVLVRMQKFVVREYGGEAVMTARKAENYIALRESWTELCLDQVREPVSGSIILIGTNNQLRSALQEKLGDGCGVLQIKHAEDYRKLEVGTYELKAGCEAHYQGLVEELSKEEALVDRIVYLFDESKFTPKEGDVDAEMEVCFYSVFGLTSALMKARARGAIKILCVYRGDGINPYVAALSGFGRSAHLENSKFSFRIMRVDQDVNNDELSVLIRDELESWAVKEVEIKYEGGARYKRVLGAAAPDAGTERLKHGGVYLITGGMGGLGAIFARHLAKIYKAKLVLSDVRELDRRGEALLEEIVGLGGEALYVRCDVTSGYDVKGFVEKARERFGAVNGIIHAAGAIRDSFIMKKKREEMELVLNAKIRGAINLDAATKSDSLDFFLMFASIAGVMGNIGQCDYAYANRFLDNFVEWREELRERGERNGRALAIDWPLWAEGGMMVDGEVKKRLKDKFGMDLLTTSNGIAAFESALNTGDGNRVILEGEIKKIKQHLDIISPTETGGSDIDVERGQNNAEAAVSDQTLEESVENDLMKLCVELLRVQSDNLDPEVDFSEYGVDSIMMIKMLNMIEARYGKSIDPNSIAMNPTIRQLARHLVSEGIARTGMDLGGKSAREAEPDRKADVPRRIGNKRARFAVNREAGRVEKYHKIAVIGMACRFPGSSSVEAFWQNLHDKNELITEIPSDRWDIRDYFSLERNAPNKSYSKWGGFIRDIDAFDAAFFGVSDEDAITMDPQQRVMLELTQELFDRSGYAKNEMTGSRTAVYIGAASNQYIHNYRDKLTQAEMKHMVVNNIPNMIAARISDYYNLLGASQTIDTACSSSLVALNEACRSLRYGESDSAIVGGVMLLIDPYFHIGFGQAEVLSPDGKSYVFDQRANGFVLGEGAGLVLLKPYERALEDGDQIIGVILGSAVNNDGHTMGVTVPNQEGQKRVIKAAIEDSGVNPDTISYLEAHGTGTLLGDPIEIKAATQVYSEYTNELQYCAVGSVKSNIGHLLTAAGIASLIKVLLALQHKSLPPTLNCEKPHPRFKFPETPFYPIIDARAWEPLKGNRRAAISSFGFGGTNCHVIIGEFNEEQASEYHQRRAPRSLTQFKRKKYWLGRSIMNARSKAQIAYDDSFIINLISKVERGEVSAERANELIKT